MVYSVSDIFFMFWSAICFDTCERTIHMMLGPGLLSVTGSIHLPRIV